LGVTVHLDGTLRGDSTAINFATRQRPAPGFSPKMAGIGTVVRVNVTIAFYYDPRAATMMAWGP
jgi:hypothetical protein